jgi:tripartite-type tricarboxylate transporter receptor subunit TctC
VVPNSSPARTVREFISYANANRGHVSFASGGVGTSLHLCGELFKRMAGIEMTHVPYRGSGPALNDLVSGRVDVMFNSMGSILPQVQAGAVRGLAVTTREKVAAVPSLPTVAQSGVPGFDVSSWFAIYAPAKTPSARVGKIQRDIATVLTYPAIKGKLEALGSVVVGSAPAALMAHLKAEMDKWGPIIRDAHITTG